MNIKNKITLSLVVLASFLAQTIHSNITIKNNSGRTVYVGLYKRYIYFDSVQAALIINSATLANNILKLKKGEKISLPIPEMKKEDIYKGIITSNVDLVTSRKKKKFKEKFNLLEPKVIYSFISKMESVKDGSTYEITLFKKSNKLKITEAK